MAGTSCSKIEGKSSGRVKEKQTAPKRKKKIPYMFTLADNSLFYNKFTHHKEQDFFMTALHGEIDFTKWFTFGERMMGFNQWATIEDYEYATTHPLDKAHEDAIILMLPTFKKLIGEKK